MDRRAFAEGDISPRHPVARASARGGNSEQDGHFIRFEGTERSPRGPFLGVFALTGRLAREGRLTEEQRRTVREGNDWYDAAYPDPATVDPTVYDDTVHPGAVAWFKSSATELLSRVGPYLEILSAHGVPCRRVESTDPGTVVYEDAWQIVVVPHGSRPV